MITERVEMKDVKWRRDVDYRHKDDEILSKDDPVLKEHYSDIVELFPNAVFVRRNGVIRFQPVPLACYLCSVISLNDLHVAYQDRRFTLDEYMQFYQDIGYSLGGFLDIFNDILFPED